MDNNYDQMGNTVLKTATVMAVLTLFSKLFGFVRELVIAGNFGTSYVVDAYVLAQSIPSILLGGILGAISTAYTPIYSKIRETQGWKQGDLYTSRIINLSTIVALSSFMVGFLLSDQLVLLFAKNFSPEAIQLTSFYLKIAFAFPIVSCSLGILNSYLQYHNHFFIPIFGGYLYNIGILLMAFISARIDARYLMFGMLLGYSLQLLMTGIFAKKVGYHQTWTLAPDNSVQQTIRLALPVFFSSSLSSLNTFVDKTLASSLSEGSIAALNYGNLITALVIGLTSSIIVTILYPKLTQAMSRGNMIEYQALTKQTMSVLLLLGIPFALGAVVFSHQVVQVIYERGAFDVSSTVLTGEAFRFYGLGIAFLAVNDLLGRIFFSMQDMKTPILCAGLSIAVNIALNLLLVGTLAHRGLALATSVAAAINMLAMSICLHRKRPDLHLFPHAGKIIRIFISAVFAVGIAKIVYQLLLYVWMPRIVYLGIAVSAAILIYLLLLALFRIDEVALLRGLLFQKKSL